MEEEKVRFQIVKCASPKCIHERALSRLQSSTSLQPAFKYIYMRDNILHSLSDVNFQWNKDDGDENLLTSR